MVGVVLQQLGPSVMQADPFPVRPVQSSLLVHAVQMAFRRSPQKLRPPVVMKHLQVVPPAEQSPASPFTQALRSMVQVPWLGAWRQNRLCVPRLRLQKPEQQVTPELPPQRVPSGLYIPDQQPRGARGHEQPHEGAPRGAPA
jgi:hypothetical protein